jgi:hypothetical protein
MGSDCAALEAQERENDVGQGEECERQSWQLAEETTLRDSIRNSPGLLVAPLKTRQSQPINRRSSHFLASRKISPREDSARPMPMHQRSTLLDHFPGSELLSFAIRKALSATREKVIFLDGFNLGTVGARMQFNGGTHGNRIAPGTIAMLSSLG